MTHQQDYILAVKTFNTFLEEKHLRKTPERFAILKKAWQMEAHFGVDALHEALEKDGYHVSLTTAYNTADLLVESGVLRRHSFGSGEAQLEAAREGHLHLICTLCGSITEAPLPPTDAIAASAAAVDFKPDYMLAYVYGRCAKCQDKPAALPND